jgi:hypothetical protein
MSFLLIAPVIEVALLKGITGHKPPIEFLKVDDHTNTP